MRAPNAKEPKSERRFYATTGFSNRGVRDEGTRIHSPGSHGGGLALPRLHGRAMLQSVPRRRGRGRIHPEDQESTKRDFIDIIENKAKNCGENVLFTDKILKEKNEGKTVIISCDHKKVKGLIALSDTIKEESKQIINSNFLNSKLFGSL